MGSWSLRMGSWSLIMGSWSLKNTKNHVAFFVAFTCRQKSRIGRLIPKTCLLCMECPVVPRVPAAERNAINIHPKSTTIIASIHLSWSSVGSNMKSINNWIPIIEIFHKKHTSSKARTLPYGLTLLKSVFGALSSKSVLSHLEKLRRNFFWRGSLDVNKMAWIAWKKVCTSSNYGILGVGSLQASNLAMLVKRWWQWKTTRFGRILLCPSTETNVV
ncbi:RNA-directed DNA polymerase, eukaryota, Reverse transcriptase zinc-binding domain protein [Artemisia annua]|uniref:RNA-directed DNA polymerase, eukaryota, Reverse transcriptase zinc-binding domain protein n=1 Tax=Artemisia annua TaxID=35608 RepID=A0A2U1LAC7_ARTAN|nr:RNA-directed DNA polymerase, eukaryota, Reverse transcriptase zinc-binding domain protein [Artemisia annua]